LPILVHALHVKGFKMRDILIDVYDDWRNNYLTIEKFAEHNGLLPSEAEALLSLAREINMHEHPES
jgi:hypothetical protein